MSTNEQKLLEALREIKRGGLHAAQMSLIAMEAIADYEAAAGSDLCTDCPPPGYPTDDTRCLPCPRRKAAAGAGQEFGNVYLPKITSEILDMFYDELHLIAVKHTGYDWTQEAVDFACLLNQHRHLVPIN